MLLQARLGITPKAIFKNALLQDTAITTRGQHI